MNDESGNALWFILLAVALLAALTVTITRSSDSTEQTGDIERLRIEGSEIMRYAASIQQAVERMRLRGLSENEISFENGVIAGYANARCGNDACKVFDVAGGGITFTSASSNISAQPWLFTGADSIAGAGEDGTGETSSEDNELLIILPEISQGLCQRINTELGIAGIPQDTDNADVSTKYTGTFPNGRVIENMAGKKTGCFEGDLDDGDNDISGAYYFYHTLIQR